MTKRTSDFTRLKNYSYGLGKCLGLALKDFIEGLKLRLTALKPDLDLSLMYSDLTWLTCNSKYFRMAWMDSKLFGLRSKTPETARSSNAQSPNYVSQEVCVATESTIVAQSKVVWITLMKSTV